MPKATLTVRSWPEAEAQVPGSQNPVQGNEPPSKCESGPVFTSHRELSLGSIPTRSPRPGVPQSRNDPVRGIARRRTNQRCEVRAGALLSAKPWPGPKAPPFAVPRSTYRSGTAPPSRSQDHPRAALASNRRHETPRRLSIALPYWGAFRSSPGARIPWRLARPRTQS